MISPINAFVVFAIVVAVLLLFRVQQKREQANKVAFRYCQQNQLQLLDGTVAFQGWHITRPRFSVAYRFRFDYSSNRSNRYSGHISLVGNQVQNIFIEETHLPSHTTSDD